MPRMHKINKRRMCVAQEKKSVIMSEKWQYIQLKIQYSVRTVIGEVSCKVLIGDAITV